MKKLQVMALLAGLVGISVDCLAAFSFRSGWTPPPGSFLHAVISGAGVPATSGVADLCESMARELQHYQLFQIPYLETIGYEDKWRVLLPAEVDDFEKHLASQSLPIDSFKVGLFDLNDSVFIYWKKQIIQELAAIKKIMAAIADRLADSSIRPVEHAEEGRRYLALIDKELDDCIRAASGASNALDMLKFLLTREYFYVCAWKEGLDEAGKNSFVHSERLERCLKKIADCFGNRPEDQAKRPWVMRDCHGPLVHSEQILRNAQKLFLYAAGVEYLRYSERKNALKAAERVVQVEAELTKLAAHRSYLKALGAEQSGIDESAVLAVEAKVLAQSAARIQTMQKRRTDFLREANNESAIAVEAATAGFQQAEHQAEVSAVGLDAARLNAQARTTKAAALQKKTEGARVLLAQEVAGLESMQAMLDQKAQSEREEIQWKIHKEVAERELLEKGAAIAAQCREIEAGDIDFARQEAILKEPQNQASIQVLGAESKRAQAAAKRKKAEGLLVRAQTEWDAVNNKHRRLLVPILAGSSIGVMLAYFAIRHYYKPRPTIIERKDTSRRTLSEKIKGLKTPRSNLDQVILEPELYEQVLCKFQGIEQAIKVGLPMSNMLFYGPPGTGKTMSAQAFCRNLSEKKLADHVIVRGAAFKRLGSPGKAQKALADVLRWASSGKLPVILVFDEAETMFVDRNLPYANEMTNDLVATMLSFFERGVSNKMMFILSTNYPDRIDKALINRIDLSNCVYFTPPGQNEREQLLESYIKQHVLDKKFTVHEDVLRDKHALAQRMNGLVGRQIDALVAQTLYALLSKNSTQLDKQTLEQAIERATKREELVAL